ncbi:unnamed protein product, partial [Porites evermanni]
MSAVSHSKDQVHSNPEGPSTSTGVLNTDKTKELLNKGIFVGPFCEKNGLDVAALQSEDLKPLKREHLTVGLVLELWKKKDSVKQMQRWISGLTPVELQQYQSGLTSQNLNKACNDLLKKSQKLGKNKK